MSNKAKDEETNQIVDDILNVLNERKQLNTKQIAGRIGKTPPTVAKYLKYLEGAKQVIKDDSKLPHIYWSLKEDKDDEKTNKTHKD